MKLRKVISAGLAVCCLTGLACSDDASQNKAVSGEVKMPTAAAPLLGNVAQVTLRRLLVDMMVNGRPAARQCADLPVLLTVTFANPHQSMVLPLPGLGWLKPTIKAQSQNRDQSAGTPLLEWIRPGLKTTSLEPGQGLRLTWILEGALPEGNYLIGLEGLDALTDKQEAAISSIKLNGAILEIVPGSADPAESAFWERKVTALTKGPEAWLASLDKALAEAPDNRNLRYEKVRALATLDRPEKARQELAGLMLEAREKLSGKDTEKRVHLPYYYYRALVDLSRRAEQKVTSGSK